MNLKQYIKKIVPGTLVLVGMIAAIRLIMHYTTIPSLLIVIGVFSIAIIIRGIIKKRPIKSMAWSIILLSVVISIIRQMFAWSNRWGISGIIISCTILGMYILFGSKAKRERLKEALDDIERMRFGGKTEKERKAEGHQTSFLNWKDKEWEK